MNHTYYGMRIVFFDGVCNLCNHSVDFLLKKDHKKRLKYASLQSDTAKEFLQQIHNQLTGEDTIIFYDEGRVYTKSTAVLKIAGYLGFPYSTFAVLVIIPGPLRDWAYDYIAKNRLKWFGKRDTCRIPDKQTIGRIIG